MLLQSTLLCGELKGEPLKKSIEEMTGKGFTVTHKECGKLSGIRCTRTEGQVSVVEEAVSDGKEICIRLDRTRNGYVQVDKINKSELIPCLIHNGCVKNEGELTLQNKPISIERGNLKLMADVLNGKAHYKIPVVFMSRDIHDEILANRGKSADELFGMAYILYEQSASTSSTLKNMTDGANVHHGAIGIYYPNGKKYCMVPDYTKASYQLSDYKEEQTSKLISFIKKYGREHEAPKELSWETLTTAILDAEREIRRKAESDRENTARELETLQNGLEAAKQAYHKQTMAEADRILDEFERDYQDTKALNERLQKEIERLTAENEGYRNSREKKSGSPLIYHGTETDHYPDEVKEIILAVLNESKETMEKGTRRRDVIEDILRVNGDGKEADRRWDEIVSLLISYDGMTAKFASSLKALGIVITDEGKHYKLTLDGDGRYQMTLSRTPSDKKMGKNGGKILAKRFF